MNSGKPIDKSRLNSIIESAPFPIGVYVGNELKIEIANESIMNFWGKGLDVVGKLYTDVLPELEDQGIFEQLRGVLSTGIPFHDKNRRVELEVGGKRNVHYFDYSFTPLYDEDQNVYGVMNTAADVTELNIAKIERQEAQEKLTLAIDSADLGTYETNLLTGEVQASPRFKKIWGVDDPITRSLLISKLHPKDRIVRSKAHQKAQETGCDVIYEARIIHHDGAVQWVKVKGKMFSDIQNSPPSLIGIVQDITDQKRFTQQLKRLVKRKTDELNRSNADLLQFAHVVSHDLKEPARKIKIFSGQLEHELAENLSPNAKKYIDKLQLAADRTILLIDGILNYSTTNSATQSVEVVDLNQVFKHILNDLEIIIENKQAAIQIAPLPIIDGAPILIQQLFYNLISNALKFSKADEIPKINITSSNVAIKGKDYLHVFVTDNGIGIEAEYLERIFTPFTKLHSKTAYEGTGLGLSLCKKIAERHGGTIEAFSQPDGVQFMVCLPLVHQEKTI